MNVRLLIISAFLILNIGLSYAGAQSPSFSFNNPLVDAADRGDEAEVMQLLRAGAPVDGRGSYGVTPLMRAVFKGHNNIVRTLIAANADVDAVDIGGATALHLAVRQGNEETAALLLQADIMADMPDNEGWTPLMRAVNTKKTTLIPPLLKTGASITKANNAGNNALTLAVQTNDKETVTLLTATETFRQLPADRKAALGQQALKSGNGEIAALFAAPPVASAPAAALAPEAASVKKNDRLSFFRFLRPKKAVAPPAPTMAAAPSAPIIPVLVAPPLKQKTEKRIEVAEAIRVPVTDLPTPVAVSRPNRLIWLQMGGYKNENEAINAYIAVKKQDEATQPSVRAIRSFSHGNSVFLRIGPVTKPKAAKLCIALRSDIVSCSFSY